MGIVQQAPASTPPAMTMVNSDWSAGDAESRESCSHVKSPLKDPPKSNPSKRHRERLNSELEILASLLPFEQSVITKLDKLSILRLAVSYLRTKSYFQAVLNERFPPIDNHLHRRLHHRIHHGHHLYSDLGFTDSESVLQALSGFLFVVTCDGEVFFASHTVEQYLGFHQSDIIHQSALELIHSEDREQFKFQLNWQQQLTGDYSDMSLEQVLRPENVHLLQRCFTVRFRCLLDNASGFITLEISGKIRPLLGQNLKSKEPPLALFALCCPFGPLPLADMPPRDYTFKSKHKMDMSPMNMDPRGRMVFDYSDEELMQMGGYDLVHPDDLNYHAAAHLELIKTGSSGLIAYRLMTKDFRWIWLQTSSRVIYKNSKPDFILCIHRHLTEDEGRDLVRKRGSEFKLPYPIIDADPSEFTTMLEDESSRVRSPRCKKTKGQLRDYLQTGRKRKVPYRDIVYGATGSFVPAQPGLKTNNNDVKAELVYPYGASSFDPNLYRSGYQALYSQLHGTADGFGRHHYSRYYGLEPRQCQLDFQYPVASGGYYSDLLAQTTASKCGYSIVKAAPGGYDHRSAAGYGLDLTAAARGHHYEDELSRYRADLRRYAACNGDKSPSLSSVAGVIDATVLPSCVYAAAGTDMGVPGTGLLSCGSVLANSLYRTDFRPAFEHYSNSVSTDKSREYDGMYGCSDKLSLLKKSSPNGGSTCAGNSLSSNYSSDGETVCQSNNVSSYSPDAATPQNVWPTCGNNKSRKTPSSADDVPYPRQQVSVVKETKHEIGAESDIGRSDILENQNTNIVGVATSVIQMSGKSSRKNNNNNNGGIAVPVVKSSGWFSSTPYVGWNNVVPNSFASQQRSLNETENVYPGERNLAGVDTLGICAAMVDPPKLACFGESW